MRPPLIVALGLATTLGCQPQAPCDDAAAYRVVFADRGGQPAFEGQAILDRSCGSGAFCHSARAEGAARYGVPWNLHFDVGLACDARFGGAGCAGESARLSADQQRAFDYRHVIVDVMAEGSMPPGRVGRDLAARAGAYHRADGSPVPSWETPEAQAAVANWLACGAPVVERTELPTGGRPGEDCTDGNVGDCIVGEAPNITLSAPTWTAIYDEVLGPWCAGCHAAGGSTGLDLSSRDAALRALRRPAGGGPSCASGIYLDPANPDASLLLVKLGASPGCGSAMPIGGPPMPAEVVAGIRSWIASGANP